MMSIRPRDAVAQNARFRQGVMDAVDARLELVVDWTEPGTVAINAVKSRPFTGIRDAGRVARISYRRCLRIRM